MRDTAARFPGTSRCSWLHMAVILGAVPRPLGAAKASPAVVILGTIVDVQIMIGQRCNHWRTDTHAVIFPDIDVHDLLSEIVSLQLHHAGVILYAENVSAKVCAICSV